VQPSYQQTLHRTQERHWWYAARRRILAATLRREQARGLPPGQIVDLGCGVGANLAMLSAFGEVLGVDASPIAVQSCHERGFAAVRLADLDHLEGLADGSASVVLLADVLEHLDDERPCLEAARRLLAPAGLLLVTVPACEALWGPSDEVAGHRRRYARSSLRRAVEPLFRVTHLGSFNTLLFPLVAAGRLAERALGRAGDEAAELPPRPLNALLREVFALEALVAPVVPLPWGVSLLCVARCP
jgi:SAM-dependent methyltransferase